MVCNKVLVSMGSDGLKNKRTKPVVSIKNSRLKSRRGKSKLKKGAIKMKKE